MGSSSLTTILMRADASTQIGSGHLLRCLALSQAVQESGGRSVFVSACETESLVRRVRAAKAQLIPLRETHPAASDLNDTLSAARDFRADWVVLDGYHFDAAYQKEIRAAGFQLMVIDDICHLNRYHADAILNQNLHARELSYNCHPSTKMLLGPDYVLLRSEFLAWKSWKKEIAHEARRILVTTGGSDQENVALKIISLLESLRSDVFEVRIVVGPANPHLDLLREVVANTKTKIELVVEVRDISQLMAWADVAISAGGTTFWELAFMMVPTCVFAMADNQVPGLELINESGAAINLGWIQWTAEIAVARALLDLVHDVNRRQQMSTKGRQLVDGEGAARVAETLLAYGSDRR